MKFFVLALVRSAAESKTDCLLDYRGKTSVTSTGRECQRWDSEYPHVPKYSPRNSGHNHCRNPDKDPKGPWCYTTDPSKRFEYCSVTDCNDGTENTCWEPNSVEYRGTVGHTLSGTECQHWDRNKPHRPKHRPRKYKSQKNYCRNPDNDPNGPWCYTVDPDIRFEYCDIPKCGNSADTPDEDYAYDNSWVVEDDHDYSTINWSELLDGIFGGGGEFDEEYETYDYNSTNFDEYREEYHERLDCQTLSLSEPGSDYAGLVSVTSSGRKCQNWQDQNPHRHDFAEYGNHNYCRNFGFDSADAPMGVWCYTTDPNVRWEFCNQIPLCQTEQNEAEDETYSTCGVPLVDTVWGRGARRAGLPSRLTSRGRLVRPSERDGLGHQRNKRSGNGQRTPMTWMEMLKEQEDTPVPQTRIMGGDNAPEKTWPWQVGLRLRDGGKLFCGGTIVSAKFTLSAAHCFEQVRSRHIFVTAGHIAKRYSRAEKEAGFQQFPVDRIISHESYDPNIIYVDIALVKMRGQWKWSEYVQPACLPENEFKVADGAVCAVTGWGVTDGDKDYLNQATIPTVNFQTCRRLLDYAVKDHTQLCAGILEKGGVDTCQGDSGGPLVCVSGGVWKLVGVTSWGFGCGEKQSPGVYTNVAKYRQWINYWVTRE